MSNENLQKVIDDQLLLKRLIRITENRVGFKLMTLMKYNAKENCACRIFSTDEKNYPRGGFKLIPDNLWTEKVIKRQENFIANNINEIKKVFFDYQLISDMGLASALNVPIVSDSVVLGVVNLLGNENAYDPESARRIIKLSPWLIHLFKIM